MQHLEVRGAVRPLQSLLGIKRLCKEGLWENVSETAGLDHYEVDLSMNWMWGATSFRTVLEMTESQNSPGCNIYVTQSNSFQPGHKVTLKVLVSAFATRCV